MSPFGPITAYFSTHDSTAGKFFDPNFFTTLDAILANKQTCWSHVQFMSYNSSAMFIRGQTSSCFVLFYLVSSLKSKFSSLLVSAFWWQRCVLLCFSQFNKFIWSSSWILVSIFFWDEFFTAMLWTWLMTRKAISCHPQTFIKLVLFQVSFAYILDVFKFKWNLSALPIRQPNHISYVNEFACGSRSKITDFWFLMTLDCRLLSPFCIHVFTHHLH